MKLIKKLTFLKSPYFLLALILLLGLILRLFSLNQPYWGDEILSLQIVKHYWSDPAGMIQYLRAVEVHPPLYYLLLLGWTHLFGFAEAAVRSLSLIFGLATIILTYVLGKELWQSKRAALLTAFLVAVMPMQIIFSQEARPYIIFSFFGLLCFFWLWRYLQSGQRRLIFYFSLAAIIGLYLHYSFIFILAPLFLGGLVYLIVRGQFFTRYRDFLGALVIIFLGFYWWLPALFYKMALGSHELMDTPRSTNHLRAFYFIESAFNQLIWTVKSRQITQLEIFSLWLAKILIFIAAFKVMMVAEAKKRNMVVFSLLFLVAVSVALFLLSPASQNYVTIYEKHVCWLSVVLALLIAGWAAKLSSKQAAVLIGVLIITFIPFNAKILANRFAFDQDRAQKTIALQINEAYQPGDIVIDNFSYDRSNLNYYLRSDISAYGFYPPRLLDWRRDPYASRETLGFLENEAQSRGFAVSAQDRERKMRYIINSSQPKRIWLAFADYENYQIKDWLEQNGWRHALYAIDRFSPLDLYVKE